MKNINKFLIGSLLVVFSLVLTAGVANAASTIGTNMSTTGTFTVTPASDSATSIRFQNTAGTSFFIADSTNLRIGIGAAPSTTFEVQGTASASYFLTGNTIQVGGFASVAYSRFGTVATTHALSATNDVLINGILEVDGKAFFDGTASVAGNFEVIGTASASKAFVTTSFVVGSNVASSSTAYVAEFVSAATTSVLFGGSSATLGTCLQMKNTAGQPVYARVIGTVFTVNAIKCR